MLARHLSLVTTPSPVAEFCRTLVQFVSTHWLEWNFPLMRCRRKLMCATHGAERMSRGGTQATIVPASRVQRGNVRMTARRALQAQGSCDSMVHTERQEDYTGSGDCRLVFVGKIRRNGKKNIMVLVVIGIRYRKD